MFYKGMLMVALLILLTKKHFIFMVQKNRNQGYRDDDSRDENQRRYERENDEGRNSRSGNYDDDFRGDDSERRYESGGRFGSSDYGNRWRQDDNERNFQGNYGSGDYGSSDYGRRNQGTNWREDENQWNYRNQRNQQNWGSNERRGGMGSYSTDEDRGNRSSERGGYGSSSGYGTNFGSGNQYGSSGSQFGNAGRSDWRNDERRQDERNWQSNQGMTGQHRGKGPKDYQRSDERIREDVCDRLCDDSNIDASNIDVKVNGSEVILSGNVDSREDKRRAEDIAEAISGVSNVQNQLRIGQSTGSTEQSSKGKSNVSTTSSTNVGNSVKSERLQHN